MYEVIYEIEENHISLISIVVGVVIATGIVIKVYYDIRLWRTREGNVFDIISTILLVVISSCVFVLFLTNDGIINKNWDISNKNKMASNQYTLGHYKKVEGKVEDYLLDSDFYNDDKITFQVEGITFDIQEEVDYKRKKFI